MEDRSRRRARLILIVGVLLALLAGAGTFFIATSSQSAAPPAVPTTDVIVAAREIPTRTAIQATDLKKVKMNSDVVPPGAVVDEKDVVGKITTYPLSIGEVVLASKFVEGKGAPFTVFPPDVQITPGQAIPGGTAHYRAYSITVQDDKAVGGAILVGDIVDILYTFPVDPNKIFFFPGGVIPPTERRVSDQTAKIVLERVPIIARTAAVYTIRTDAATAERIAYLQAAGAQIQMLLRAPQDDRVVNTAGATLQRVFTEYRLPVPEKLSP